MAPEDAVMVMGDGGDAVMAMVMVDVMRGGRSDGRHDGKETKRWGWGWGWLRSGLTQNETLDNNSGVQ